MWSPLNSTIQSREIQKIYILSKIILTMAKIDITKMSSKGQIVIPQELREDFAEGDKIVVIRNHDQIILKKADKFDKQLAEDLEFARRTEEAYKRIEAGKGKRLDFDEFIKEMKTW